MKYVALLRGINVGGNNKVSMKDLKAMLEDNGYTNVITYINSGNVIFETSETDIQTLRSHIEHLLEKTFSLPLRIVIRKKTEMQKILKNVPSVWHTHADIRCYVAFVREPVTPEEVASVIIPKEGIDTFTVGPLVVYMTTSLSGITKSGLNKITSSKVYTHITIRNFNTLKKILALME